MVEVSSILTRNGLWNILCEQYWERNFKFTIGATHVHTVKYLWDEDSPTVEMTSDENDTIVDTENYQSEVETG